MSHADARYDSCNVIIEVIFVKHQQFISSVFLMIILMLASGPCMYSLQHEVEA